MAIVIATTVTGSASELDIRAATLIVNRENARRAALDPPGVPLSTALQNLAASYQTVLNALVASTHASFISQASDEAYREAKEVWDAATDAQRAAALQALTT